MSNLILSILKKEIMDNIRNKWIIIVTIIFASLTLLASYAGSIFSDGWQDLGVTISAMSSLVNFLVTIIALILGYSSIVGEIENGSLSSLLSLPVKRLEILIGKFLGLATVLTFTILVGFGLAGIIIGINVANVNYLEYLIFIGATIFVGLVFLSIGILISCFFNKRSAAMGTSIFVFFFFTIIWQFIITAIIIATGSLSPGDFTIPDWYYAMNFFNPLSAYGSVVSFNVASIGSGALSQFDINFPSFYNTASMLVTMLIWLVIPLVLSYFIFERKDI